jgi:hypothetical protein
MAKKNIETNPEYKTILSSDYVVNSPITISSISLTDLMLYEKACILLCRHYENIALLDNNNNSKYIMYKNFYEKIFNELENRVGEIFKE